MKAPAPGDSATHLPWLSPCAASLAALACLPAPRAWEKVRLDPGAVLLILRHGQKELSSPSGFPPLWVQNAATLEDAAGRLGLAENGWINWHSRPLQPILETSLRYAQCAARIAERTEACDPAYAWAAGLLAPLGWLAIAAVDPEAAVHALSDSDEKEDSVSLQLRHWGMDQNAIARRLSRHWGLPRWVSAVSGHLDLAPRTAQGLGADPVIFRIVQLAVGQIQRKQQDALHLRIGAGVEENAAHLALSPDELECVAETCRTGDLAPPLTDWVYPGSAALLPDLLRLAAANVHVQNRPVIENLERDVDHLHRAFQEQQASEEKRLQEKKLSALAEFAGGAGHEINNPLAVISGQAQYLLNHEPDTARQGPLRKIIQQAHRVHQILTEVMQFSRPQTPQKQWVDIAGLVREVSSSLNDLAAQKKVQIVCPQACEPVHVFSDPRQVQVALTCLLRNAIEAAPAEGWAGVRLESAAAGNLNVIVEDNGGGPSKAQYEHLFDPFFSGRQAGRGRGLGLPTAWRLARAQGGDVRFEAGAQGPTRFVLSLPGVNGTAPPQNVSLVAPLANGCNGHVANGNGEGHH